VDAKARADLGTLSREGDRWKLTFVRPLPHTPEKVWRAVTEPEHLAAWYPQEIVGERRAGAALRAAPDDPGAMFAPRFDTWIVLASSSDPNAVGSSIAAIAAERGTEPIDALCDLLIADDLTTIVQVPAVNRDHDAVATLVADEHTLVGLGDAGSPWVGHPVRSPPTLEARHRIGPRTGQDGADHKPPPEAAHTTRDI